MGWIVPGLIGLSAGVLGGLLGIGGSLVIIPALVIYLSYTSGYQGVEQHLIQAAAMITNVFVAAPSVLAHLRARAVMPSIVWYLVPSALVGILTGVALSNSSAFARENGIYLALILSGFLVYVIGYNIWRLAWPPGTGRRAEEALRAPPWKVVAVGLPTGVFAGLLGVGGGAICVPIQQVVLKIPLRRAIANSATTIVFVSCVGATYKNLTLGQHGVAVGRSLLLAATLIPTAILGSYFGGRLTHVLPQRMLRIVFIAFLATVTVLTFTKAWKARTEAQAEAATPPVRRGAADPAERNRRAGCAGRLPHFAAPATFRLRRSAGVSRPRRQRRPQVS